MTTRIYKIELYFEADDVNKAVHQGDLLVDNSCGHRWYKPWNRKKCLWQVAVGPLDVTHEYVGFTDHSGVPLEMPETFPYDGPATS